MLDRMNRYKVSEVEKLAQTVRALEEAVLAGGDAANVVRDYEHKRQEMSGEMQHLNEKLGVAENTAKAESQLKIIDKCFFVFVKHVRNRQVLAPRKNANNFEELKAKEKPPQIFKPRVGLSIRSTHPWADEKSHYFTGENRVEHGQGLAGKIGYEDSLNEEKSLGEYEDLSDYEYEPEDEPNEPDYESGEDLKECFDYDELHLAYSGEKSPSGKFKLSNVKRMIVKVEMCDSRL
ncbi:microtubule-associated protein 70-2 [Tanacetum coccineum]|uniref:Microtubule-associated protein 70-2 n=1 Tax=Tanacetum coccineum TaxID=301880 RepID=A0ABQ5B0A6_9ASTR